MQPILDFMLSSDLFRILSGLMYVFFALGLVNLARLRHQALARGEEVKQYPAGYFTFLSIQLIPLLVTGLVIGDAFVIGTRLMTLMAVVIVYGISASDERLTPSRQGMFWIGVILALAVFLPIAWSDSTAMRDFVRDFQPYIAWGSVAVMILFVFKGQVSVAQELFEHFRGGSYTVKRLNLQFVRFFGFFFQTLAYWYAPSKAAPLFGFDPIFLQGLIGVAGVLFVLLSAAVGYLRGGKERRKQRAISGAMSLVKTV